MFGRTAVISIQTRLFRILSEKWRFNVFVENEGDDVIERHSVQANRPHNHCAHFIYTLQTPNPPRFTAPSKKPVFRPLFADLGHFLTSDVILKENFCRLASIWLIDLMKLFALGRIDSAVVRKLWLAGKVAKFTEKVVILLRILSSVGDAWRPPGHPRRLRPVQVVSLLDTVVYTLSRAVLVGVVCDDLVFIISPRYWTFHHL